MICTKIITNNLSITIPGQICVLGGAMLSSALDSTAAFFFSRDNFLLNACPLGAFIGLPAVDDSS